MVPKRLARNVKLHRTLKSGQKEIPANSTASEYTGSLAIPFDGEKLEQMLGMSVKGLIWYHWGLNLESGYGTRIYTVTKVGEKTIGRFFRGNVRARVTGNLGNGTFVYEGVQAMDDPCITAWRFGVYGGLVTFDDSVSAESIGSQIIVMTGPDAAFRSLQE